MGFDGRWLVCAGAREFVAIASAIVAAEAASGVVWEPSIAGARIRAAEMRVESEAGIIVGDGLEMDPDEALNALCTLASLAGGAAVLCRSDAVELACQAASRGVVATVEPRGLARLLMSLGPDSEPVSEGWSSVDVGASGASILQGACNTPSMRTSGRFPRTGVIEELAEADAAVSMEDHAPVAANDGHSQAEKTAPLATEPMVYRPLLSLPIRDGDIAGMDKHVPTLCFTSARGGVGKSSLAVMSALALARSGLSVALVDLDFQFGTSLGFLGSDETDGLFDMGDPVEKIRIDARSLARCRTTPEAGLAAFEFCKFPEQAEVLAGMAGDLLKAARAGADIAIVDMPTGIGEAAAQVFELSDRCLLVTDQRAFSIESLSAQQSLCTRIGVARTKLVTVVNRCDPRHRDEGYLERLRFSSQAPQTVKAVDGGGEVTQMFSIGSAGELLTARNRFALSVSDLAHVLAADLGCHLVGGSFPGGQMALPLVGATEKKGFLRKGRKERKGEVEVECPF